MKNEWLTIDCGIGFEEIVFHIECGDLLDIVSKLWEYQLVGRKGSIGSESPSI